MKYPSPPKHFFQNDILQSREQYQELFPSLFLAIIKAQYPNWGIIATSFPGLFPRKKNGGREKTLASAGHVFILHPEILGVIN